MKKLFVKRHVLPILVFLTVCGMAFAPFAIVAYLTSDGIGTITASIDVNRDTLWVSSLIVTLIFVLNMAKKVPSGSSDSSSTPTSSPQKKSDSEQPSFIDGDSTEGFDGDD